MQCSIKREIRKQVSKGYLKMYIEVVRENIFRKISKHYIKSKHNF